MTSRRHLNNSQNLGIILWAYAFLGFLLTLLKHFVYLSSDFQSILLTALLIYAFLVFVVFIGISLVYLFHKFFSGNHHLVLKRK
ncbi:MAG TPA: hypothetical protein VF828_02985 [Patescibacteria group bacterium]